MDAVSSDASVESKTEDNKEHMKIGIFSLKSDVAIAKHLQRRIQLHCSNVEVYDEDHIPPAGCASTDAPFGFIDQCHIILWLATDSSVKDRGYMEYYRIVSQNEAIQSKKGFAALIPKEHLNITLPRALQAKQPLKENEQFEKQIKSTLEWFRRKLDLAPLQSVPNNSDVIQGETPVTTPPTNYNFYGNIENVVIGNASGIGIGDSSHAEEATNNLASKSVNQVGTTESDSNSHCAGDPANVSSELPGQKEVATAGSSITDNTEPLRSGMKQPEPPARAKPPVPAIYK